MTGLGAVPANAAPDIVQVSPDGVTYSANYSGSVFTTIAKMVPGESQNGSLYVRNASSTPGFLRIVLKDVTFSDQDFADALTMSATTPDQRGTDTPVTLAEPCWVLLDGAVVPGGASVRVNMVATIGQLDGLRGQGATASASLGVSLSDISPGSLSPTNCGAADLDVPLTPRPPTGQVTPGTGQTDPTPGQSGGIIPTPPNPDLPVLGLPGIFGMDPNTWHLFEEYWILLPMAAFVVGLAAYWLVARRRRRDETLDQTA